MFYRLAGSHRGLLLITLIILIGLTGMMSDQIRFLAENHHMNFIPGEVEVEAGINVLIAAFGVFLEHRNWLLSQIYGDQVPKVVADYDQYCLDTGVLFIILAILIECADVLFLAANNWGLDGPAISYAEIAVLFVCNLGLLVAVLRFFLRSCSGGLLANDPLRGA
ncbi:MAG: hypothetical protein ACPGOV_00425 [Magnetovibrionaceae bacterium]